MATTSTYMYEASDAFAKLLAREDVQIYIFIEYKNEATAGTPTPPTVSDLSKGIDYYLNDIGSGAGDLGIDFLRLPIVSQPYVDTTDAAKYEGNRVTFYSQSQTIDGHHGKAFGNNPGTSVSHVWGAALVLVSDVADATKDKVILRCYFDDVIVKPASGEVSITIPVDFTTPAL